MIKFLFNLSRAIIAFAILSQCAARENHLPLYKNKVLPVEKRVEDLLKRMTLDEKLAQLQFQDDTNAIGVNGIGCVGFLNNGLLPSDAANEINKIQQYLIRNTRGVTGFVGPGSKVPIPLTNEEVRRMGIEDVRVSVNIEKGDYVNIVSGPLETFQGVVEEVDSVHQKVKVKVSIFNRDTSVDLDFVQVKKV